MSSKIFGAYRALGVNSDHVPCVVRYNQKHQETYVITSVGRAFHVYKVCSTFFFLLINRFILNVFYVDESVQTWV